MLVKSLVSLAIALLFSLIGAATVDATPLKQERSIAVTPAGAVPGQTVHVAVSGLAANTTFCVGVLGPGQNLQLGIAPSFRISIGQVATNAAGAGEADLGVSAQLVPGVYQAIVGGCPPQQGLAPLAALATTTLTVLVSAQGAQVTFFFAEGSTQPPFDTWFLVENPLTMTVSLTFTFFLQPSGTVEQSYSVGPTARFSLFANEALPNQAFSTRIDASAPIFAERAMYVSYDGDVVAGIPFPNRTWLFAEGATVPPFHTWLLLQNPNGVVVTATVGYLLESGQTVTQTVPLPANSRTSIFVNQVLPNAAFSARVQADQPIIAERAMYRFPGNAATVNSGVVAPATSWFFAEGRTSFRDLRADTFLLLENPDANAATASITLFGTNGSTTNLSVALSPTSRLTLFLNPLFSGSFGIRVVSAIPIIVERSVFFGNEPLGAYSTEGATALATRWHLAEGETRSPFDEMIFVLNPNSQSMDVQIEFLLATGQVVPAFFTVAPNSKLEVEVDRIVAGANSANVTTTLPSVVERVMFIFKLGSIGAHNTVAE